MTNEALAAAIEATFNLINRTAPAHVDLLKFLTVHLNSLLNEQNRRALEGL